jgi:hypothetical protein
MTDATTIIKTLGGNPGDGMCKCPAHDDGTPSLHVTNGRKGVVFCCQAGCSQEAVMAALKSRGLWGDKQGTLPMKRKPTDAVELADDDDTDYDRFKKAFAILRAAYGRYVRNDGQKVQTFKANDHGKLADYLKGRGIGTIPECAMFLPTIQTD